MERKDLVLAVLSSAKGALHSPVQVQKMFFLVDENISEYVGGKYFCFKPWSYGPFDNSVYIELEELAKEGFIEICPQQTWRSYRLTEKGQAKGEKLFKGLNKNARDYIREISIFVRGLTFTQLVSVIYKEYPEMRTNSVFQE